MWVGTATRTTPNPQHARMRAPSTARRSAQCEGAIDWLEKCETGAQIDMVGMGYRGQCNVGVGSGATAYHPPPYCRRGGRAANHPDRNATPDSAVDATCRGAERGVWRPLTRVRVYGSMCVYNQQLCEYPCTASMYIHLCYGKRMALLNRGRYVDGNVSAAAFVRGATAAVVHRRSGTLKPDSMDVAKAAMPPNVYDVRGRDGIDGAAHIMLVLEELSHLSWGSREGEGGRGKR